MIREEATAAQTDAPPDTWQARAWRLGRRLVPWVSLGLAIASAVSMDRRPARAHLIAAAAVAGWLLLFVFALVDRLDVTRLPRFGAWLARAARASSAAGAQSLIQLCLFFALPFYAHAAAVPEQWGFIAVLAVAAAMTLWTPLCAALLRRKLPALALQSLATFAGLGCVLPLLGVSIRASLAIAAAAVVAGAPFIVARGARSRAIIAAVAAVTVAVAALFGAARFIPPAPLRFVAGAIGTRVVDRALVDPRAWFDAPDKLVCWTAIAAPDGLHDRLRHVWRHQGVTRYEAALEIRGGRALGFRAWSFQRNPAAGDWSCTIATETGQVLGRVTAVVSR